MIESATFALTSLPTAWTAKHYDQFAGVVLNPNSLYWIEVSVHSASDESVIEWGTTADISGPGVASNYSAWSLTDDGFFLNKGIDPFALRPSDEGRRRPRALDLGHDAARLRRPRFRRLSPREKGPPRKRVS